jgi:hypothetical protein
MPHSNHANGHLAEQTSGVAFYQAERRLYVLRHGVGIASRSVGPLYPGLLAVGRVDVVEANGGRSYELHPTSLKKSAVASSAGAQYQGVGIVYRFGRKLLSLKVADVACYSLQSPFHIGYLLIYYYFHLAYMFTERLQR